MSLPSAFSDRTRQFMGWDVTPAARMKYIIKCPISRQRETGDPFVPRDGFAAPAMGAL